MSNFKKLQSVSVSDKVMAKGKISYLSWANAWSMLKNEFPDATRTVYEDPQTGWNYFTDGKTAWVKVGVTVGGIEHIDYLPVMDYRNSSIPIERVTSFDVTKTIQRSTTKAIAMHGLGISLWTKEEEAVEEATPAVAAPALVALEKGTDSWERVLSYINDNYQMGVAVIGKQLQRKYTISNELKKEIKSIIESKSKTND